MCHLQRSDWNLL